MPAIESRGVCCPGRGNEANRRFPRNRDNPQFQFSELLGAAKADRHSCRGFDKRDRCTVGIRHPASQEQKTVSDCFRGSRSGCTHHASNFRLKLERGRREPTWGMPPTRPQISHPVLQTRSKCFRRLIENRLRRRRRIAETVHAWRLPTAAWSPRLDRARLPRQCRIPTLDTCSIPRE